MTLNYSFEDREYNYEVSGKELENCEIDYLCLFIETPISDRDMRAIITTLLDSDFIIDLEEEDSEFYDYMYDLYEDTARAKFDDDRSDYEDLQYERRNSL